MPAILQGLQNKFGATNLTPLLPIPGIPAILTEWAAVIPLVCHLASYKSDYELVGRLALDGRLSVDIFPRLGVLSGLSRLLERGPEFIDQASSKGSSSWRVWDVLWGSIFPCANCGASEMVMQHVLKTKKNKVIDMPDTIPTRNSPTKTPSSVSAASSDGIIAESGGCQSRSLSSSSTLRVPSYENSRRSSKSQTCQGAPDMSNLGGSTSPATVASDPHPKLIILPTLSNVAPVIKGHRRYQTLHLLQFKHALPKKSWFIALDEFIISLACETVKLIFCIGIAVVLCLFGAFGTATIMFCGGISQMACRSFKVHRPCGYLKANEQEKETFMLVGMHQNTSTWYLFAGDRSIVDSLLNKTMIVLPPSMWRMLLSYLLRATHALQLLAMTFVAAQKGWDGVSLVILMLLNYLWGWRHSDRFTVRRWMEVEGVNVNIKSFQFTGRTMMCGAIHCLSGSDNPAWMDEILSPHPRRDAWINRLCHLEHPSPEAEDANNNADGRWSVHDWKSITLSSELALAAAKIIRGARQEGASV